MQEAGSEARKDTLSHRDLEMFMEERRRSIWLISMIIRPCVHIFSSHVEYSMYPPDTEENDSFELLEIPWEGMMWHVMGVPVRDTVRLKQIADVCGLRIADGVPMIVSAEKGKVGTSYFPMNTRRCFTLESTSLINPPLNPHQQQRILKAEQKLCERVWKGWSPTDDVLRGTIKAIFQNVRNGKKA